MRNIAQDNMPPRRSAFRMRRIIGAALGAAAGLALGAVLIPTGATLVLSAALGGIAGERLFRPAAQKSERAKRPFRALRINVADLTQMEIEENFNVNAKAMGGHKQHQNPQNKPAPALQAMKPF